jgi:hypothetical protein
MHDHNHPHYDEPPWGWAFDEGYSEALYEASEGRVVAYLASFGDAVEERVKSCIAEADALSTGRFPGASLTRSITALELAIRWFLVVPMVHGAFNSDEWVEALVDKIIPENRTGPDRRLLPELLRNWDIDVTTIRSDEGGQLWEEIQRLIRVRNRYVHRGEKVAEEEAAKGLSAAKAFLREVVDPFAVRLGFSRDATGCWHVVERDDHAVRTFTARDPYSEPD